MREISTRKSLTEKISFDFSMMQTSVTCDIKTVGCWIVHNANTINKVFLGSPGRKLMNFCNLNINFYLDMNGTPQLETACFWEFFNAKGNPIDFTRIDKYLPSLTLEPAAGAFSDRIYGNMKFDLNEWQSLVPTVIVHYFGISQNPRSSVLDRDLATGKINLLLARFYPQVTYDFLCMASDLGMTGRGHNDLLKLLHNSRTSPEPAPLDDLSNLV